MYIACDRCKQQFVLEVKQEITKLEDGRAVEVNSIVCPFCGSRYVAYVDDERTKELAEEIKSLIENNTHTNTISNRLTRKQNKLAKMRKKLKRKVERSKSWQKRSKTE